MGRIQTKLLQHDICTLLLVPGNEILIIKLRNPVVIDACKIQIAQLLILRILMPTLQIDVHLFNDLCQALLDRKKRLLLI